MAIGIGSTWNEAYEAHRSSTGGRFNAACAVLAAAAVI